MIIKTEIRLGKKPSNTKLNEIIFLRFQLAAPIKTNIIKKYKTEKLFNILGSKYLKKNLSNKIVKNGKIPK